MSVSADIVNREIDLLKSRVISQIEGLRSSLLQSVSGQAPIKINLLIPMAGAGSRFANAGYTTPKPMIPVKGKPMVRMVVDNVLAPGVEATFIYVVQREHYIKYGLKDMFESVTPGCKIYCVDAVTEGAACTCLIAREAFENDTPLLIANSDQFVEWDAAQFYRQMRELNPYGGILCFLDHAQDPKWSFARTDDDTASGKVVEVKEKVPISKFATVGVYYWRRGRDFCADADLMIKRDIRVKGEFYVCPVYEMAIERDEDIRITLCDRMWGTGTPEDLTYFEANYHGPI